MISNNKASSSPEDQSSLIQKIFFHWVRPIVDQGYHSPLSEDDLLPLAKSEDTKKIAEKFLHILDARKNQKRHLSEILVRQFKYEYLPVFLLAFLNLVCILSVPWIIRELINLAKAHKIDVYYGVGLAILLFFVTLLANLSIHHVYHFSLKLGMRIRSALVMALYSKSLKLSANSRSQATVGEIVNLMAIDCANIYNTVPLFHQLFVFPSLIFVSFFFLFNLLGWAALSGIICMLVLIPISVFLAKKISLCKSQSISLADKRISEIDETLASIKLIKSCNWQKSAANSIDFIRQKECHELKKIALFSSLTNTLFLSSPFLVAAVTFCTLVFLGHELRAAEVFASLTIFGILRGALSQFPAVISAFASAKISAKRMERFFVLEEYLQLPESPDLPKGTLTFCNLSAKFPEGHQGTQKTPFALSAINLNLEKGTFCVIAGKVGAGKSAILGAVLGELETLAGSVSFAGRVSLVPQQPWIMSGTLQENILLGRPLHWQKYSRILEICQLAEDLARLENGDQTQLGEKGVNLSGGQKQRICIARALYAEPDIVLLDESLSALDKPVALSLLEQLLMDYKGKTTIVLVTHRLDFAKMAHQIVFVEHGQIAEMGDFAFLTQQKGKFADAYHSYMAQDLGFAAQADPHGPAAPPASSHNTPLHSLPPQNAEIAPRSYLQGEERHVGSVRRGLYLQYARLISPKGVLSLLLVTFALREIFTLATDSVLTLWTSPNTTRSVEFYAGIYLFLGIIASGFSFIRSYLTWGGGVRAAEILHQSLLKGVLHAPLYFFDKNPSGRILNRFSKDMEAADQYLPSAFMDALGCLFTILSTLVLLSIVSPFIIIFIIPATFFYYRVQQLFRRSSREAKRIENVARSPIYAHFSESLTGSLMIRVFRKHDYFADMMIKKFEFNQRAFYTMISLNRWLGARLEVLGAAILLATALLVVFLQGTLSPGIAGMCLTYSYLVTGALNWTVRMISEVESTINSVERIQDYAHMPAEGNKDSDRGAVLELTGGDLEFRNVEVQYPGNEKPVLQDVSFKVTRGSSVGLVGRTGSGKSTLFATLLGFVNVTKGTVFIDGIDIRQIPLDALRQTVAWISQDPILLTGTVRKNLDPFQQFDDSMLKECLAKVGLFKGFDDPLNFGVGERGSGLSAGERQLLCLARAILRKARILLIDEASSNVDFATDLLMQRVIDTEFKNCTKFIIAHRSGTLAKVDRILELAFGKLIKYETKRC